MESGRWHVSSLHLEDFRSFRHAEVSFPVPPGKGSARVLIGSNGSGKSNLLQAFPVMRAFAEGRLEASLGDEDARREAVFRGPSSSQRARLNMTLECQAERDLVELEFEAKGRSIKVTRAFRRSAHRDAAGEWNPGQRQLYDPTAPLGLMFALKERMQSFVVHHHQDTSTEARFRGSVDVASYGEFLGDCSNLPAVIHALRVSDNPEHSSALRRIESLVARIAPGFVEFATVANPENRERVYLRWRRADTEEPWSLSALSTGTIRFIALAVRLLHPEPPGVILIDEPEIGLHPHALELLAGMVRVAERHTQVIMATQSPEFLSLFAPEQVLVVDNEGGRGTTIRSLDAEDLAQWLRDYSLGELWSMNVLGGQPY